MERLRRVLAETHVAAIAIALLLLWSVDAAFRAVWPPMFEIIRFIATAVAILDIPYFSPTLNAADRLRLVVTSMYLYDAIVEFFAAWLLARWVYNVRPIRCLTEYRSRMREIRNA